MMMVRVFREPSGHLHIMRPAPSKRLPDETDKAFVKRVCDRDMHRNPRVAGLPFVDIDEKSLPVYTSAERNQWRINLSTKKMRIERG